MNKAEDQIRRAMEDGKFDDLPGRGKPLRLDHDPFEDPEWRMAHHVLRNGGFTLPWIDARQEIERSRDEARESLRRAWVWRQEALAHGQPPSFVEAEWKRAEAVFCQQIAELNKRIFSYNLQVPAARLQLLRLDVDRELDLTLKRSTGEKSERSLL
jgi:DnaJ family protein C protein 28